VEQTGEPARHLGARLSSNRVTALTPVDDRHGHYRCEDVQRKIHLPKPETQVGQMRTAQICTCVADGGR